LLSKIMSSIGSLILIWGGAEMQLAHFVRPPLFGLLYQPWMMDGYDCGAIGEMISEGNRTTQRKPPLVPLCPPQIPQALSCDRT
jgi:hypothetical protein